MKETASDPKSGFTMVEMILVILLIALIAWAVFPLLKTSFESWELADRRAEVAQIGRAGMSQLTREIRNAWDIPDHSTTPIYVIDYYPIWSSAATYTFIYYASPDYGLTYGATGAAATLAYPVDSFSFTAYDRRIRSADVTRSRRVNSVWFGLAVSDERRKLPAALNPRSLRSAVQMRIAREGYFIAKSYAFASQSYFFDRSNCDNFCIKVFNDRINPPLSPPPGATVTLDAVGTRVGLALSYFPNGDYYATCCFVGTVAACGAVSCDFPQDNSTIVEIRIDDGTEQMSIDDEVQVRN